MTWSYRVTNTGNVALIDWSVTDDEDAPFMVCPRIGLILPGRTHRVLLAVGYGHRGPVREHRHGQGECPSGRAVDDSDPSHYFGVAGRHRHREAHQRQDADEPPGPFISVGGPVALDLRGHGTPATGQLTGVTSSTDLRGGELPVRTTSCRRASSMTCTGDGNAVVADQYANLAIVDGHDARPGEVRDDDDPSHYFGAVPGINIEKDTNGVDADTPEDAPLIPVGDAGRPGRTSSRTPATCAHRRDGHRRPGRDGDVSADDAGRR